MADMLMNKASVWGVEVANAGVDPQARFKLEPGNHEAATAQQLSTTDPASSNQVHVHDFRAVQPSSVFSTQKVQTISCSAWSVLAWGVVSLHQTLPAVKVVHAAEPLAYNRRPTAN